MSYADVLGFLDFQGRPPMAVPGLSDNLALVHLTAAPPFLTGASEILREVQEFSHTISGQPGLKLIAGGKEMSTVEVGRTRVVLGLQSAPQQTSRENLQRLCDAGIRIIAVSYRDPDHRLGSGFGSMVRGLTEAGRQFIRNCSELGLIVDLSHAGHQTARDVLQLINEGLPLKVMASHGGCYSIYEDPRNLPDDVLEQIAAFGGIVGIFSLTFSLHSSDNTSGPMLQHIRHALSVCGDDYVAVGSDGIYRGLVIDEWRQHIDWMRKTFDADGSLGSRWPDTPLELNGPDRMERIERSMKNERFGEDQIRKVLGGNLIRFLSEALPSN